MFLVNKYYLDDLYEKIIVAGISGPIARGAYWINQNVIDAHRQPHRHHDARRRQLSCTSAIDQGVVDQASTAPAWLPKARAAVLRLLQSGKVQQYGALLFGAAAIGALTLVIIV